MEDNIVNIENIRMEQDLLNELKNLTVEQRQAMMWLIRYMEVLDLIDSGRPMTEEEERRWMERAGENQDYMLMLLVHYKHIKDQERTGGRGE